MRREEPDSFAGIMRSAEPWIWRMSLQVGTSDPSAIAFRPHLMNESGAVKLLLNTDTCSFVRAPKSQAKHGTIRLWEPGEILGNARILRAKAERAPNSRGFLELAIIRQVLWRLLPIVPGQSCLQTKCLPRTQQLLGPMSCSNAKHSSLRIPLFQAVST